MLTYENQMAEKMLETLCTQSTPRDFWKPLQPSENINNEIPGFERNGNHAIHNKYVMDIQMVMRSFEDAGMSILQDNYEKAITEARKNAPTERTTREMSTNTEEDEEKKQELARKRERYIDEIAANAMDSKKASEDMKKMNIELKQIQARIAKYHEKLKKLKKTQTELEHQLTRHITTKNELQRPRQDQDQEKQRYLIQKTENAIQKTTDQKNRLDKEIKDIQSEIKTQHTKLEDAQEKLKAIEIQNLRKEWDTAVKRQRMAMETLKDKDPDYHKLPGVLVPRDTQTDSSETRIIETQTEDRHQVDRQTQTNVINVREVHRNTSDGTCHGRKRGSAQSRTSHGRKRGGAQSRYTEDSDSEDELDSMVRRHEENIENGAYVIPVVDEDNDTVMYHGPQTDHDALSAVYRASESSTGLYRRTDALTEVYRGTEKGKQDEKRRSTAFARL